MKHVLFGSYLFILTLCCSFRVVAQSSDTIKVRRNVHGKITFASFKIDSTTGRSMENYTRFLQTVLQMESTDELRLINSHTDTSGITHKRLQQYYKGIKVENANK